MYEDVVKRLESLGYTVNGDQDVWLITFILEKVTDEIQNELNIGETDIPDGLYYVAVDMICGEFLAAKKGSGQLTGFDVEEAVKQIKEGDTSITYAVADGAMTLDGLIYWLRIHGKSQFVTFRRFAW